ncbi:MAG: CCA tRNA nucleotidyltransferase, partial [Longimicrobiales bacterium]|nr:CCA tRNA nucleotidyltransferase [Longimicrobiales bacterium]
MRWIVSRLETEGYETWAVGGAVRDALLGHPSGDWDLATRAPPEEVRRLFRRTVPVGVEHGTVGVLAREGTLYEVTTFRRDVETTGRHAVVAFAETLAEDLARRDFTVNAIAWHPVRGEWADPHGGAADLERRRLRTVGEPGERFAEDYLRVLRALRFAGRFGLEVAPGTWSALCAAVPHLGRLSSERVREELWKVLAGDATPARSLELYRRSGALAALYPELARVAEASGAAGDEGAAGEGRGSAPEGAAAPAWDRTLAVLTAVRRHRPLLRLAVLLGEVGSPPPHPDDPPLTPDGRDAADPARARGRVRSAAVLTRLRHANRQVATVSELVGIGPQDRERPPAVLLVDLGGQARGDAVFLEEHDEVADVPVLGPGAPDLLELDLADALDLAEPVGVLVQDLDRLRAEGPDD